MDMIAQLNEVKTALGERFSSEVESLKSEFHTLIEKRDEEIRKNGEASTETARKLDAADEKFNRFSEDLAEIKGKVDVYDAQAGRLGLNGSGETRESIGEMVTKSEAWQAMIPHPMKGSDPIEVGAVFRKEGLHSGTGWGGADALIPEPTRLPMLELQRADLRMRDLLGVIPISTPMVQYVREVGFANLYTELTSNAASSATTLAVKNSVGMFPGMIIDVNGVEAEVATVPTTTSITITAALGTAKVAGDPISSAELGFTPHGEIKPQANIEFEEKSHGVGTIAHWIPAHKQTLADAPQMRGIIDNRLLYGLKLAEEQQLLYGNGLGSNLSGIMVDPAVQDAEAPTLPGSPTNSDRAVAKIDHVRHAITLSQLAQMPPTGAIVNPVDWEGIETAKGSDNHYIQVQIAQGRVQQLWRLPLVVTTAIRPNQFLVGAFGIGAYILDRENATVEVSNQHADFFTRNMVAILAEERIGLALVRPEAFVKGTWS